MTELPLMCLEFLKAGLFAVGGGLATLPFLSEMSAKHPDWFTVDELANIVAVAESSPGPIGINMSTFAGFKSFGVLGGILTTLSLVLPSFIIILIVSRIWEKYKENESVQKVFTALRAAAIGLIFAAGAEVFFSAVTVGAKGLIFFAVVMALTQIKKVNKLHPIVFIALGAIVGVIFKF